MMIRNGFLWDHTLPEVKRVWLFDYYFLCECSRLMFGQDYRDGPLHLEVLFIWRSSPLRGFLHLEVLLDNVSLSLLHIAVLCVDLSGCVAAGVSTSGPPFKHPGRVGDSPLPGCGLYADNEVRVFQ